MSKPKINFEDLKKLAVKKERTPCGKQAFSKSLAGKAAKARNEMNHLGKEWFVVVCYFGCGREIFHLTTTRPCGKRNEKFNRRSTHENRPSRRNRKKRNVQNRRAYEILSIGTWEGEGGALHPRDLED